MAPLRRAADTAPDGRQDDEPDRQAGGPPAGDRFDAADPAARRAAVVARGGDPAVVGELLARFDVEPDALVRAALATRLSGHDADPVAAAMARALRHPAAAVRSCAVDVLASTVRSTGPLLAGLLADDDRDVRALTVTVLARSEDPRATGLLRGVVAADPDPVVVSAALSELLVRLGGGAADDVRAAAARFPADPYIGFAAATAPVPS